jgi:MerR family transcriptional regulator, light-induced transcriptional regulator
MSMQAIEKCLLSPRELADAIGVSESSIKRWADDGSVQALRTAGGHRRIPIEEAISFIRDAGHRVIRPEILGLAELDPAAGESLEHGSEAELLHACLRDGRSTEARGLVLSLYLGGWSIAQIIDGPVQEAMSRLGEAWKGDDEGIFLEHRATDILIQTLNHLRSLLRIPAVGAPHAIGAAPSGDPYILATLSASLVISEAGFRTTNLGPETPIQTLERAAVTLRPNLVWLSVSACPSVERLRAEIHSLADVIAEQGGVVVVGGRAARALALGRRPALHVGASMAELEAFVTGLAIPTRPAEAFASGLTAS